MTKNTVGKKILSALHEGNITSNDISSIRQSDLVIKLENICTLEGIDMEKYDVKSMAKEMQDKGFNEIKIPIADFVRKNGFSYNKSNFQSYLENYSSIQKDVAKFENHFSKNQIGSLHILFLTHLPKNLTAWRKIVFKEYGDDLRNQITTLRKRILGFVEQFSTVVKKRKLKREVEGYAETFIINKSYHGFMIQYCTVVQLSEYLDMGYKFGSDKQDSRCIDALIGHRCVSIKPLSFEGSEGKRFVRKSVPIIYYEIKDGNIILNYEQLMKGPKND